MMGMTAGRDVMIEQRELAAVPGAVGAARRMLDTLTGRFPGVDWDATRLMLSELAANAVRHGADVTFAVCLSDRGRGLRVAVISAGAPFEVPSRRPPAEQIGGRGLWLVGQLADRWGTDMTDGQVRVWFDAPCA